MKKLIGLLKNILYEIKTYWKSPKEGEYLNYKEFTNLIVGDLGVQPYILYFGLLIGATLGGNITPIGASANIIAIGILRKQGYEVKTLTFIKIGLPFTLVAVLSGYALIWAFWH